MHDRMRRRVELQPEIFPLVSGADYAFPTQRGLEGGAGGTDLAEYVLVILCNDLAYLLPG
ncbi:hypothetical protein RRF57_002060 [Xylaria bambusicola]|uniref:Uncharacterized protein n=1 Tax=Xylaria bambusicola TaxID=326684 RepID=A0AAN7YVC2_9PEZI